MASLLPLRGFFFDNGFLIVVYDKRGAISIG
jgi:hypothetical protein